jgi:formylglycine-generating enzyme
MASEFKDKIQKNITIFKGTYRVLSEIEDIAFGTRYYAEGVENSKLFFLEVFYEKPLEKPEDFAALEDEFFSFVESRPPIAQKPLEIFRATLEGIPHEFPVSVLEKPDGPTLRAMMKMDEDGCMDPGRAYTVMAELCSGLEALAEVSIFHGRLCPEHIVLTPQNEVFLLFIPFLKGLHSVPFDSESPQRFYGAPELYRGEVEIDLKTEIYALGCLLHEVLEGGPPFLEDDQEEAHLEEDCPGLDGIPSKVHKLILRCLHKNRDKRPAGFSEIEKLLLKFAKTGSSLPFRKFLPVMVLLVVLGGGFYGYNTWEGIQKKKRQQIALKQKQEEERIRKEQEQKKRMEKVKLEAERKRIEEARRQRIAQRKKKEERKKFKPPEIPGMVLLKGGGFSMGDVRCYEDCSHVHLVEIDSFYMDLTEITNEAYKDFVDKKQAPPPSNTRSKYNLWNGNSVPEQIFQQPVINVSWEMAKSYCEWKQKRLPTEAEWEFAARGRSGRLYPWGSNEPTPVLAQFDGEWAQEKTLYEVKFFEPGRSPEGLYNLLGGVKEWVQDWYSPNYYQESEKKNPSGPGSGDKKAVRGGSWEEIPEISAYRDALAPNSKLEGLGFRCAKTLVVPQ